jgi:hypothetical protein
LKSSAVRRLVPDAIKPYKARSMIEEYKGLAILFAVLFVALAVYFIKSVLAAPKPQPPPAQSVYVELVPRNEQPAAR